MSAKVPGKFGNRLTINQSMGSRRRSILRTNALSAAASGTYSSPDCKALLLLSTMLCSSTWDISSLGPSKSVEDITV